MLEKFSKEHRRFIIVDQGVGAFFSNAAINVGICWAIFNDLESVSLWGPSAVGYVILTTGFMLPFLTSIILSGVVSLQIRMGKLKPMSHELAPASGWHRYSSFTRGLLLGIANLLFITLPLVYILSVVWPNEIAINTFLVFIAIWTGILGVAVSPLLAIWVLRATVPVPN